MYAGLDHNLHINTFFLFHMTSKLLKVFKTEIKFSYTCKLNILDICWDKTVFLCVVKH